MDSAKEASQIKTYVVLVTLVVCAISSLITAWTTQDMLYTVHFENLEAFDRNQFRQCKQFRKSSQVTTVPILNSQSTTNPNSRQKRVEIIKNTTAGARFSTSYSEITSSLSSASSTADLPGSYSSSSSSGSLSPSSSTSSSTLPEITRELSSDPSTSFSSTFTATSNVSRKRRTIVEPESLYSEPFSTFTYPNCSRAQCDSPGEEESCEFVCEYKLVETCDENNKCKTVKINNDIFFYNEYLEEDQKKPKDPLKIKYTHA